MGSIFAKKNKTQKAPRSGGMVVKNDAPSTRDTQQEYKLLMIGDPGVRGAYWCILLMSTGWKELVVAQIRGQ
jgi:hypothetical protein